MQQCAPLRNSIRCVAEVETFEGVRPKLMKPLERLASFAGQGCRLSSAPNASSAAMQSPIWMKADEGEQGDHRADPGRTPRAPARQSRGPYRVWRRMPKAIFCALTWFGKAAYTAKKLLPVGEKRWIAGRLDRYGDMAPDRPS